MLPNPPEMSGAPGVDDVTYADVPSKMPVTTFVAAPGVPSPWHTRQNSVTVAADPTSSALLGVPNGSSKDAVENDVWTR
jgi:hypothetical protein